MTNDPAHPIVFLWCHPRSMSTAMERVMRQRGDFECFHEPFMYDYYVHRRVARMPHFDIDPSVPVTYEEIKTTILEAAEMAPVFVKDMSYYVVPGMFEDREFAGRVIHSFLIRNPVESILSYFKLDNALTREEVGLEAQWKHASWLQKALDLQPVVLLAEEIRRNPRAEISAYWQRLGIDAREHAFEWSTEEVPGDWQSVSGWHGEVSSSNGIRAPSEEREQQRLMEFEALAQEQPRLQALLDHHRPFYEQLKKLAEPAPN